MPQAQADPATFHELKAQFGGLELSDARWLKQVEDANAELKRLLAMRGSTTWS